MTVLPSTLALIIYCIGLLREGKKAFQEKNIGADKMKIGSDKQQFRRRRLRL